jgi:RNA polymerase sigma factor (sigma-70 family)
MYFDIEEWLEQVAKLDQLIVGKLAEREKLYSLATNMAAKLPDGMPYSNTGTVSRKVENAVVNYTILDEETDALIFKFKEQRQQVINALEQLSPNEYAVLHRRYIRYMSWDEIAHDMGYCTSQVWRIKKKALKNLKNIKDAMKCN